MSHLSPVGGGFTVILDGLAAGQAPGKAARSSGLVSDSAGRLAGFGARNKQPDMHVEAFVDVASDAGSIPAASTINSLVQ